MDRKESRTAWIIAGVLAVLLVIAVVFWMNTQKDLDTVLQEGQEDITVIRDRIAVDCRATDTASQERCADHLEDLADILEEFSEDVEEANEQATSTNEALPQ